MPVKFICAWHQPPEQAQCRHFAGVQRLSIRPQKLDAGINQEHAEHHQQVFKPLNHRHAGHDKHEAHHQRAKDAPEERAVLVLERHPEVRKDHCPHEYVVNREALFDQIGTEILHGCRSAFALVRKHPRDDACEGETQTDPPRALDCGFAKLNNMRPPVKDEQVDQERRRYYADQHRPAPNRDRNVRKLSGIGRRGEN